LGGSGSGSDARRVSQVSTTPHLPHASVAHRDFELAPSLRQHGCRIGRLRSISSARLALHRMRSPAITDCDIAIVNPATSAPTPNETPFGSQSDRTSHLAVRFAEALQDAVFASPEPALRDDLCLAETAKSYTAFCTVC
jgi:hypothetical protein